MSSPAIYDAKKKAYESIDLLRYKLERNYKKFDNMLKSRKMRKAKELESNEFKRSVTENFCIIIQLRLY